MSCAPVIRLLNGLLLCMHFGHLDFPSHCLLYAVQNAEEASPALSNSNTAFPSFQKVTLNGEQGGKGAPGQDPSQPAGLRAEGALMHRPTSSLKHRM